MPRYGSLGPLDDQAVLALGDDNLPGRHQAPLVGHRRAGLDDLVIGRGGVGPGELFSRLGLEAAAATGRDVGGALL